MLFGGLISLGDIYSFFLENAGNIFALALAVLNVISYVPMLGALLFRRFESFHQHVVSDIPGNVHQFDSSIISLFRTLPEPNNFNIVYTSVPFDRPLVVKGKVPLSRISSISIYGQGSTEAPNCVDLADYQMKQRSGGSKTMKQRSGGSKTFKGESKTFKILVANEEYNNQKKNEDDDNKNKNKKNEDDDEKDQSIRVSCNSWKRGMVVMRNYMVPPGTKVVTPEIYQLGTDNKTETLLRNSEVLISGAAAHSLKYSALVNAFPKVLFTYMTFWYGNEFLRIFSHDELIEIMLWSIPATLFLYISMFLAGHYSLKKFTRNFSKSVKNQLFKATLEQGCQTSQPSALHSYWIMEYKVPVGGQLSIRGRIDINRQKYWSLVPYDMFGLPIGQLVYDVNVSRMYPPHPSSSSSLEYTYDIRFCNGDWKTLSESNPHLTIVDVSSAPIGYCLFRLVHPVDVEQTETYSSPVVTVIEGMQDSVPSFKKVD